MRRIRSIVPGVLVVCAGLCAGACETSKEKVVYVPATSTGTMAAGDQLGMALMRANGALQLSSREFQPRQVAMAPQETRQFTVAATQGGYVTMASSVPAYARSRASEVRMPMVTFAATDGPSAD